MKKNKNEFLLKTILGYTTQFFYHNAVLLSSDQIWSNCCGSQRRIHVSDLKRQRYSG